MSGLGCDLLSYSAAGIPEVDVMPVVVGLGPHADAAYLGEAQLTG